jgi:hypothetical protein
MNKMEYDTICMSGGGIKGFSFIGALDYLNKKKFINTDNIKNWVGTSIGSIIAYVFVCGFSIIEMEKFIIEFDFTKTKEKDSKKIFRTHKSVRIGIGGYAGLRVKSKQKLCYEIDGNEFSTKEKGDFNVNDFIYGVSTYIGYKETSLYLKYDLNPMFADNAVKQNNVSLGVRFDFN